MRFKATEVGNSDGTSLLSGAFSQVLVMAVRLVKPYFRIIHCARSIMSGCSSYNKVRDELKTNPYFEKYANKIESKFNPEELAAKIEELKKKKSPKTSVKTKEVVYADRKAPSTTLTKKTRTLDEIMKTSLLEGKTKEEIVNIWTEYHKSKEVVFGTLAGDVYQRITENGSAYPTFLLPLPRNEGYEFIMLQFEGNEVHFTPLISYQAYKADAPECLTLVYYSELLDSNGVVLMKGEFDKNILSPIEAQCLVNTLHLYYGEKDEKRLNLMHTFTHNPDSFKYMDLVAEMDNIPIKG